MGEGLFSEQGEAVPGLESAKAQQSGIADEGNTSGIFAENRTTPEEAAVPGKMLQAEQETKGAKTMADMGLPMDGTEKLQKAGNQIVSGEIKLNPTYKDNQRIACQYCPFRSVCKFDAMLQENNYHRLEKLSKEEVLKRMEEELHDN